MVVVKRLLILIITALAVFCAFKFGPTGLKDVMILVAIAVGGLALARTSRDWSRRRPRA